MTVRTYRPSDRASLIELWRDAFPDDLPHNEPERVIDAKLAVDDLIFVAVREGALVGACIAGYDGHRGWLYAVATSKGRRREGTGTALVEHAVQALRALGCVKVNLQLRADNAAVASFYRSLGFAEEDRISMGVLLDPEGPVAAP